MRRNETTEGPSVRLLRLSAVMLALYLAGCSDQRSFDAAAWKADSMTEADQILDVRRSMVDDIERQFRPGTSKAQILRTFGPPEHDIEGLCDYPGVDSCLAYDLGASLADYDFLIFAFSGDRLVRIGYYRS